MPWDEIDSGKFDSVMNQVRALIAARKENRELKSMKTDFLGGKEDRHIMILKDKTVLVAINADVTPMKLEYKDVIFARKLDGDVLECGGCAICRI